MEQENTRLQIKPSPHLFWVYGLTVLGGYFNCGAILLHARPSSHHTGNLSSLAIAILDRNMPLVLELTGVMLAFVAGTVFAGWLFHERKFSSNTRYGLCLLGMGAIILAASLGRPDARFLLFLGAAFMGLQNGLFIFYKSILVRTTHVTGTFTDFGFALGALLRGKKQELPKVLYYGCAALSFLLGGFIAPFVLKLGAAAFWAGLSAGYFILGAYYFYLRKRKYFFHH